MQVFIAPLIAFIKCITVFVFRYIENPVGRVSPLNAPKPGRDDFSDEDDSKEDTGSTGDEQPQPLTKLQQKFKKMSEALCEVMDDYGLVSFQAMNIQDAEVCQLQRLFVKYQLRAFSDK